MVHMKCQPSFYLKSATKKEIKILTAANVISTIRVKIIFLFHFRGGWVVRRCHVSYFTGGVQLILAYSWARPAILVAGKSRGGAGGFISSVSSLSFLILFLPCPSLSSLLLSLFSLSLGDDTK